MDLKAIVGDRVNVAMNREAYVNSFSPNVKDIFARYKLPTHVADPGTSKGNRLKPVIPLHGPATSTCHQSPCSLLYP